MPDQPVRITNLPDSGSPERVAYDLWVALRGSLPEAKGIPRITTALALYSQCLNAARNVTVDTTKIT
jgi:hypothetical protein